MRKYGFCLVIFSLCLLMLSGCGKLERKGTVPENSPPIVYFSNIPPPESTYFSMNPEIHWYGTDADGFVAAFQYAVMVKDSVISFGGLDELKSYLHDIAPDSSSWVNQTQLRNMTGVHVVAEPGGHVGTVKMYADMDPDIYTPQYILVRGVDNRGGVSEVISRMYWRNNHRPEAFFDVPEGVIGYYAYCLEETTATWKGIEVSWYGLDTADYPEINYQPDFEFKWDLVGPFADSLDMDSTKVVQYSLRCDTIAGEEICSRWVFDKSYVFKNLENFSGLGYGWYRLRLRARDDASVSTDTVTTFLLKIYKPQFRYADQSRKTVLLVDATVYGGNPGGVSPSDAGQLVRDFYHEALTSLRDQGVFDEFEMFGMEQDTITFDLLAPYDLVIVTNLGSQAGVTDDHFAKYRRYLDVGGRVWFVGMNNFGFPPGRRLQGFETIRNPSPNAYQVGVNYCGLQSVFTPSWSSLDSMTLEFMQAKPFGDWQQLPVLSVDTTVCKGLIDYQWFPPKPPPSPVYRFGSRGIPWVTHVAMSNDMDWAFRVPAQRRIYSFVSYYGFLSPMHDRPCGVNFVGPTFRTAVFTFPPNLMKNEEPEYPVHQVMKEVIEWFWENLP